MFFWQTKVLATKANKWLLNNKKQKKKLKLTSDKNMCQIYVFITMCQVMAKFKLF